MDEFEQELKQAFERRPAPPRLKRRVLEEAQKRRVAGRRLRMLWMQRVAAGVVLAAAVSGLVTWRLTVERRKGEQARDQVMTALRITGRALNEMKTKLAERDREE
jgi:hypothetical protein